MPETVQRSWGSLSGRQTAAILAAICAGGMMFRIHQMDPGVPLIWDAILYFWYATDAMILGALPPGYDFANNGWPLFLAGVFALIDSNHYMDYMAAQRITGAALSVLAAIPIYYICRRFLPAIPALAGPAILVFDPRIAENSLRGYTEPLFVLLASLVLACFLARDRRIVWAAFPIISLAAMVRGEATVLIVPYLILYIARFRGRRAVLEAALLALVFLLVLAPMLSYRIDATGTDGIFMRITATGTNIASGEISRPPGATPEGITTILVRNLPLMAVAVPPGAYLLARRHGRDALPVLVILGASAAVSAVALSAYFVPRYMFIMLPMWSLLAALAVSWIAGITPRRRTALVLVTGMIIAVSVAAGEYKRSSIDLSAEADGRHIAAAIWAAAGTDPVMAIEASRMPSLPLWGLDEFPVLRDDAPLPGRSISHCADPPCADPGGGPEALAAYLLGEGSDITHLVADGPGYNAGGVLLHMFENAADYPYLEEIYDSRDAGFAYHVKAFAVDRGALERHP
ncbi:MAG: glycosyltransferase family 39 protein [Alphaproteobacteria bacterium]|nr:glycosyltransferase family 39 protein [Alphaproteobacteria bacterium]